MAAENAVILDWLQVYARFLLTYGMHLLHVIYLISFTKCSETSASPWDRMYITGYEYTAAPIKTMLMSYNAIISIYPL